MKFGKVLKVSSENMPSEMHDLFLRYKELKKQIKLIPVSKEAAVGDEKQASVSPNGSSTGTGSAGGAVTATVLSPEEQAFISTLNEDLARFNKYFIEKEEEAVIRLQALCDELAAAVTAAGLPLPAALADTGLSDQEDAGAAAAPAGPGPQPASAARAPAQQQQQQQQQPCEAAQPPLPAAATPAARQPQAQQQRQVEAETEAEAQQPEPGEAAPAQLACSDHQHQHQHRHQVARPQLHAHHAHAAALQAVKSRLVQFHGEMVLLLHWSLLNYAAVVKILKKHDKRTGVLLRAPYLANVLQQPFSSTTIMSRLAKRAEELVVATTQLAPGGVPPGVRQGAEARAAPAAAATAGAGDSDAVTTATDTAVAVGGSATAGESSLQGGGEAERGAGAAAAGGAGAAASAGRETTPGSEVSALTLAGERGATYADAPILSKEPLVGSTMHALETWANLRKNAITPSTVLGAEVEQPGAKRKADALAPEAGAAAAGPAGKAAKADSVGH